VAGGMIRDVLTGEFRSCCAREFTSTRRQHFAGLWSLSL
jgi:hypothetical protein